MWERAADAAGVPRFTLMGVLGGLAARGEHHDRVWELLGVEHAASTWELDDIARRGIAKHKVTSAFLHYSPGKPPYPAVLCTSRNEVIVHARSAKRLTALIDRPHRLVYLSSGMHRGGRADVARRHRSCRLDRAQTFRMPGV
jgi:hypothetical protein